MRKYCNKITIFFLPNTIKATTLFRQKETTHKTWLVCDSIIGKFSLLRVHGHFTKSLYNFPVMLFLFQLHVVPSSFFMWHRHHVVHQLSYLLFGMQFQSQGQNKPFSFLRGKLDTKNVIFIVILYYHIKCYDFMEYRYLLKNKIKIKNVATFYHNS